MPETTTPLLPPYPQRSNAEKRDAVLHLLHDPAWCRQSDRAIAQQAGVHHQLVGRLRKVEESSSAPCPESGAAQPQAQPARTPLTGEGLAGAGLSPAAAQRLLTRFQAMPPGKREAAERLLEGLLL